MRWFVVSTSAMFCGAGVTAFTVKPSQGHWPLIMFLSVSLLVGWYLADTLRIEEK